MHAFSDKRQVSGEEVGFMSGTKGHRAFSISPEIDLVPLSIFIPLKGLACPKLKKNRSGSSL